MFKKTKIYK